MKNPLIDKLEKLIGQTIIFVGENIVSESDLEIPLENDFDNYFTNGMVTRVTGYKIRYYVVILTTNISGFESINIPLEGKNYRNPKTGLNNVGPREGECYTKNGNIFVHVGLTEDFPFEIYHEETRT